MGPSGSAFATAWAQSPSDVAMRACRTAGGQPSVPVVSADTHGITDRDGTFSTAAAIAAGTLVN
jgi:hypothetical protein